MCFVRARTFIHPETLYYTRMCCCYDNFIGSPLFFCLSLSGKKQKISLCFVLSALLSPLQHPQVVDKHTLTHTRAFISTARARGKKERERQTDRQREEGEEEVVFYF